jgi:hypothetical protein
MLRSNEYNTNLIEKPLPQPQKSIHTDPKHHMTKWATLTYCSKPKITMLEDIVCHDNCIVLPNSLHMQAFDLSYDDHSSISIMFRRIHANVLWRGIYVKAENFVKACYNCQMEASVPQAPKLYTPLPAQA